MDKLGFVKWEVYIMKKYTSRATKWLAIFSIINVVMLLTGIILIVANYSNVGATVGLTMGGGLMSVLLVTCFFAEKSHWLTINDDEIVLPRGADINGKTIFKRTYIKLKDIASVESKFYKGDKIISGDCFFHTLKLKDGTKITFTLFAYGKDGEKEILETIKKSI